MIRKPYIISRPWGGSCGIGHQFLNWVVAWSLANRYDLEFVHAPFCGDFLEPQIDVAVKHWEKFLGFGAGEIREHQLSDVRRVQLPLLSWGKDNWDTIDCDNPIWKDTIKRYKNDENVLLECAKNQFMRIDWPYLQSQTLKEKYWKAREDNPPIPIVFDKNKMNVAIHIRRGDVSPNSRAKARWVPNSVYVTIINQIRELCGDHALFHIYSDGVLNQLQEIAGMPDVVMHLRKDIFSTFHHMVIADILVTGQSSLSSLAGYLCDNIKVVRPWAPFWERFPDGEKFIIVNPDGKFNIEELHSMYLRGK